MNRLCKAVAARQRGAALIIVLAFVVLLTGVGLAYLSRTTSDRQVAHGSFNQSAVDQLAQSGTDNIIGDLRQEIVDGSTATTVNDFTIYAPTLPAYAIPQRSGNPSTVPNLIRRSIAADQILFPGRPSRASAVNSTIHASANGRSVTAARWNSHYLVPKANPLTDDSVPIGDFASATPDWVFVNNQGVTIIGEPNASVIGRYAYAIYDEGGLLDVNLAGYPTGTTTVQAGRKGSVAYSDLGALPYSIPNGPPPPGTAYQVDKLVGWRNYATTQPRNNFPDTNFANNFRTDSVPATNFYNFVKSPTNAFLAIRSDANTPPIGVDPKFNGRTDQMFLTRQELLGFRAATGFSANALQYLSTFSRELNTPSWAPTLNATDMGAPNNGTGNIYAYKDNAANPAATPINPNFLNVRVCSQNGCGFTRADGTTANPGDPLINRRFPLTRLTAITPIGPNTITPSTIINGVFQPATTATIQRDFGLYWDDTNKRWNYRGASGANDVTRIERLDEVAGENREPNFFELLKAVILSGSVGMGSGTENVRTFVAAERKYYDAADTIHGTSSDYQIMQIGANIISQWDSSNIPVFIGFGIDPSTSQAYELAGIKNLPYFNKLVFKPYWRRQGSTITFDAWLLPTLWNPHQNAPTPAGQNVRVSMTLGAGTNVSVTATSPDYTSSITSTQFMIFDVGNATYGPTPSAQTSNPSQKSTNVTQSPDGYYGFHFPQGTLATSPSTSSTAYPEFGASCTFELQVQVNGSWKSYQTWTRCAQPATRLVYRSSSNPQNNQNLQDPEFVTLDPRTLRFGVWGNDGFDSGITTDYTTGVLTSLDQSVGSPPSTGVFELIPTALATLRPNGSMFVSATSPNLYLYANNTDTAIYYKDLDSVKRQGDAITPNYTTAMQPTDSADRPLALNGAFQSVADLGHVFRDQPWKTLKFTSASADPNYPMKSPDDGLLDIFTLHEVSVQAGKTSLNTRQAPVLKAILSKAALNLKGTSIITSTQVDDGNGHGIVPALMSLTTGQPMVNKAELVTRLAASSYVAGLGNKEARECVVRAFSDAGQTRTWNLVIDVIAQTGRYLPNAASLENGFVVEGEQRYWVHVAIDRFTGQVIDKQIEVVNE